MGKHRFWLTALTLIGAFLGGVGLPALANTITVTTTNDELNTDGECSLREAIVATPTRRYRGGRTVRRARARTRSCCNRGRRTRSVEGRHGGGMRRLRRLIMTIWTLWHEHDHHSRQRRDDRAQRGV
jgi:CSLREA domain-containing protein